MAVVRNLMIRIGADYSAARQAMQGATRELNRFKNDATRTTRTISGTKGIGGITTEFRNLGRTVTSSLSQIRGAKGIGGVASALGNLRPVMGTATKGLAGLGAAAAGAGAALGSVALGVGAVTAALGLMVVGLYQASQEAVRFDASIKRLNMQLGANSRAYMDWARSMGLAKTSAAEMGATYATLLASFIHDNNELARQTMQLVHTTRVVASATGRSIEDVTERMRSGLLGNTEAIEDLGIFVNVSMIESTEAFRRFAGDKSWNQLTYQQQQQIRLAAILEQAYKRYGNQLQANVMTKQERLMEQLKDIKLHLSQAFLPIWDAILPALTRLAEALANATEHLARFMYWLRGWDYDEMTRGSDKAADAIDRQADSYDELAESAKKAVKQLASFDEINQLGDFGDGSKGGTGSSGGGGFPTPPGTPSGGVTWDWPEVPPALTKRYRIEFDPPRPPDAGMGAVATAVTSTVNDLVAQTKAKFAQLWNDLQTQTQVGAQGQLAGWSALANGLNPGIVPGLTAGIITQWRSMWDQLRARSEAGTAEQQSIWQRLRESIDAEIIPGLAAGVLATWATMWSAMLGQSSANTAAIQAIMSQFNAGLQADSLTTTTAISTNWQTMLASMLAEIKKHNPLFAAEFALLSENLLAMKIPMAATETNWRTMLANMLSEFRDGFMTSFTPGWALLGATLLSLNPALDSTRISWSSAFDEMRNVAINRLNEIIVKINEAISTFLTLQSLMGAAVPDIGSIRASVTEKLKSAWSATKDWVAESWSATGGWSTIGAKAKEIGQEAISSPFNQAILSLVTGGALGSLGGVAAGTVARGVGSKLSGWLDDALSWLTNLFRGGATVPAFASGGIVYGPTLAMIGEAGKEAVIPLENTSFVDTLASAIGTAVVQAQQVAQSGQESDREIVIQIDGTTLARVLYPYQQQEQQRRGPAVIKTV